MDVLLARAITLLEENTQIHERTEGMTEALLEHCYDECLGREGALSTSLLMC